MKKAFYEKTYKKLYPSGSQPGLFFGLAKIHKVPDNSTDICELPLRPVVSNIGTATYNISKYLANELFPLTKNRYTIESTKDFINKIKGNVIGGNEKLVSFDVTSLFTNVPLDFTIDLILSKIYRDKIIKTKLKENQFRELLQLCTKNMHFLFNDNIYRQVDGVAMGSPLGPVLANIFMAHLESSLVPSLSEVMSLWYRYVDDTITFIQENKIEEVIEILNNFHPSINFTYEKEKEGCITFLDVKLVRKTDGNFITEVYRKKTDTNIYLHWKAYAPDVWKIGTLKGLFRRAFVICSEEEGLNNELNHLKEVFSKINGYPFKVINKTLRNVEQKMRVESVPVVNQTDSGMDNLEQVSTENIIQPYMVLPYKGYLGNQVLKEFRNKVFDILPTKVSPRITFKGRNLGSFFPTKDKVKKEHRSNIVYEYTCDDTSGCNPLENYIGETGVRFEARSEQHTRTDKQSAVYRHSNRQDHSVAFSNFNVLSSGFNNVHNRKIAEALWIKDKKPSLNEQKFSYKLALFN